MDQFVFEGTVRDFDAAHEQSILLRQMENRKIKWMFTICFSVFLMFCGLILFLAGEALIWFLMPVAVAVLFLLGQASLEYQGRPIQKALTVLYKNVAPFTAESEDQPMSLTFQGDVCLISRGGEEGETWSCKKLSRASESETIFCLRKRGRGFGGNVVSVPKDCLKEGTLEDFRAYLNGRLKGRTVQYYAIPDRLQEQLKRTRLAIYQQMGISQETDSIE